MEFFGILAVYTLASRYFSQNPNLPQNTPQQPIPKSTEKHKSKLLVIESPPDYHDVCSVSDDCECRSGFKRKGFKQEDLVGKTQFHTKHIFLCSGQKSTEWVPKIEDIEGSIAKSFSELFKKTSEKVKISNMEDCSVGEGTDILVFPDMIRYFGVTNQHVDSLVTAIASSSVYDGLESQKIDGSWIFICCHHSRDVRCGTCGPRLYKQFNEQLKTIKVPEKFGPVHVRRVSHCAAHAYAGNVIVYKYDVPMKKYFGDFYGFVEEKDVETIIKSHLVNSKIHLPLWAGRCDCPKETAQMMLKFLK